MIELNKNLKKELIDKAIEASENTFNPDSSTKIGSAIITEKGNIYVGCLIKSAIEGLGICAERCAINNAVANGEYKFLAIATYFSSNKKFRPCGMCLQYIYEFSQVNNKNIKIIMINKHREIKTSSIKKLLPKSFGHVEAKHNLNKYRK